MTIREMIEEELDKVPEDRLAEILQFVRTTSTENQPIKPHGLMANLRRIRIDGPADFSENIDQYLSGEKRIEGHLP